MDRDTQEDVFIHEIEKRIDQLASELDLDSYFILGYLARLQHKIQRDMDEADDEYENEDND